MKILCISDHKDPLVYSSNIKTRFSDIDIILSAGDLPLDFYGFIASMLNKPFFFIFGNHHLSRIGEYKQRYQNLSGRNPCGEYECKSCGAVYIGGRIIRKKGLLIAGLGGTKRYNDGLNQYTETEMFFHILGLIPRLLWNRLWHKRYLDILLTHAPPHGSGDAIDPCHQGFKIFLWFIRMFRPQYLIHGHIHLYDMNAPRETKYYGTKIINAYDHTVVEVTPQQKKDLKSARKHIHLNKHKHNMRHP